MAEDNLREVLARIKAQSSQQTKVQEKKVAKTEEEEQAEEEADFEEMMQPIEEEETPKVLPPSVPQRKVLPKMPLPEKKEEPKIEPAERQAMEIELLQNNGRFRAEILFQLQGIKEALSVIAQLLIELTGHGKEK